MNGNSKLIPLFGVILITVIGLTMRYIVVEYPGTEIASLIREDGKRILVQAAVIGGAMVVWAAVFFPATWLMGKLGARCWFGHKKKWVAVFDRKTLCHLHVEVTWHRDEVFQVARWICDRRGCRGMGEKCLGQTKFGAWTAQHGELVCDEKKWANP